MYKEQAMIQRRVLSLQVALDSRWNLVACPVYLPPSEGYMLTSWSLSYGVKLFDDLQIKPW